MVLRTIVLGALVVFTLATGCGSRRLVVPIAIDPSALVKPPATARDLTTHEAAVRGVAAIVSAELGLPVPPEMTVYVYGSRRVFEQGLIEDARLSPGRAAELSEFAIGVGKRRQLLFNDEVERRGREWLRLIAHEVTHVSQFELAEGEGRGEQWLAEGMSEWVAFQVLERFGLDTMARRRSIALAGLKSHATMVATKLDLESFGTPRGFTVRHLRDGSLPTYQLAFLMSDYLITKNGLPRVADYFRHFRGSRDRHANFARAFGQPIEGFEAEVLEHLRSAVR